MAISALVSKVSAKSLESQSVIVNNKGYTNIAFKLDSVAVAPEDMKS